MAAKIPVSGGSDYSISLAYGINPAIPTHKVACLGDDGCGQLAASDIAQYGEHSLYWWFELPENTSFDKKVNEYIHNARATYTNEIIEPKQQSAAAAALANSLFRDSLTHSDPYIPKQIEEPPPSLWPIVALGAALWLLFR